MCGRYYINEETAREIEKAAGLADEIRRGPWAMGISPGEICPTDRAPVLAGQGGDLPCQEGDGYGKASLSGQSLP